MIKTSQKSMAQYLLILRPGLGGGGGFLPVPRGGLGVFLAGVFLVPVPLSLRAATFL